MALVLLTISAPAWSASATFGRGQSGDYAVDKIDMVSIGFSTWTLATYGNGVTNTSDCRVGQNGDGISSGYFVLFGTADLFTLIPPTSGTNSIEILSAELELLNDTYDTTSSHHISRVLTDWLVGTAGDNEAVVNQDVSAPGVEWASDPDGTAGNTMGAGSAADYSWGVDDFDGGNSVSTPSLGWATYMTVDVTDLVQDMYDANLNAGFVIINDSTDAGNSRALQDAGNTSSNFSSPEWDPQLRIEYHYPGPPPEYTLTVVSGTGSGTYTDEDVAAISADAAATGMVFSQWVGDTGSVADANASNTTVTMLADTTVTATYSFVIYELTVNSGSGSGGYTMGQAVAIQADAPVSGLEFGAWIGETAGIADIDEPNTTITMGPADAAVTATYGVPTLAGDLNDDGRCDIIDLNIVLIDWGKSGTEISNPRADVNGDATVNIIDLNNILICWGKTALSMLTVVSGSGGGVYEVAEVVAISADLPAVGTEFAQWTGDTAGIADTNSASTSIAIPAGNANITATYSYTSYTLTVVSGSGGGQYTYGHVIAISADAPPSGEIFAQWVGDTAAVADMEAASTNLTIPDADVTLSATYAPGGMLTVVNGTPSGTYPQGRTVSIAADAASQGQIFDQWIGDTATVSDVNDPTTTIVISVPDATVTAVYRNLPLEAMYAKIKYPYVPFDGGGNAKYYCDTESTPNTQRIQELDALWARWGQKPYNDLWDGHAWKSERTIFTDVSTGATIYKLTNDYGSDGINYHGGSWTADGGHIVWRRNTPLWENQTSTHGLTVMKSDGTDLRPIGRQYVNVKSHQCSKHDPNIVFSMEGTELRSFNIINGNAVDFLGEFQAFWHLKMSMDGNYLMGRNYNGPLIWIVSTTDSNESYEIYTDPNTGIHDSFLPHPTLNYAMYWREGKFYTEGFKLVSFDSSDTILTGVQFDWNHGAFGLAPLPDDANNTPYVTGFHGNGWYDGGSDGLSWEDSVDIYDPIKTGPAWNFIVPVSPHNSYCTWMPEDEPWAFASALLVDPYVSELWMSYVFPVTNEAANRFRICQIGNRSNTSLDGCDGSPDGTKILFNSNLLMCNQVYYVVARLPECPVDVSAIQSGDDVLVAWDPGKHHKETAGYNVYRSTSSGSRYTQVNPALVTSTSYADTSADSEATYFYVVTAVETSELEGNYSDEAAYNVGSDERTVFVEAEDYDWHDAGNPAFWRGFYGTCSNLYYIWQRKSGTNAMATITVDIPRTADYYIWVRMKEGGCTVEGESFSTAETRWTWVSSGSPVSFAAGSNDLDVNSAVYGTGIDALYLTTDSGFTPAGMNSMDTRSPDQLTGLSATPDGPFAANVSWDVSTAIDLHHYNLYIGSSADFACDSETLIASPAASSYLDWQLSPGTTHYYKVTAVDRQGNESTSSTASSVTTGSLTTSTLNAAITGSNATVNVTTAGNYALWLKFDNYDRGGYVYVTLDGGSQLIWYLSPDTVLGRASGEKWMTYGDKAVFNLSAGNHTFHVTTATSATFTDIKVTNDLSWKPSTYFVARFAW